MRHVGLEARLNLLERLFLIPEEREGRVGAVLVDIGLVELGTLEAGVVEHHEFGVLGEGGGG